MNAGMTLQFIGVQMLKFCYLAWLARGSLLAAIFYLSGCATVEHDEGRERIIGVMMSECRSHCRAVSQDSYYFYDDHVRLVCECLMSKMK